MSVYDGLVICHPKEYCTTWDFCTHYIPHVKGDACSCDSCVPCDIKTALEHRKKMRDADQSARDKWWIEQIENYKTDGFGSFDADEGDMLLYGFRWKQLKKELEEK